MNMHTLGPVAANATTAESAFTLADELCEDIRRANDLHTAYKVMDELELDRDEVLHSLGEQIKEAARNADKLASMLQVAS